MLSREPIIFLNNELYKLSYDKKIQENTNKINHILSHGKSGQPLKLDIYGSNFQIQVWRALLQIPLGHVVSYQSVAVAVGNPNASRAVGTAVGSNPISLLIPCHRVIAADGTLGGYAGGLKIKTALLNLEKN